MLEYGKKVGNLNECPHIDALDCECVPLDEIDAYASRDFDSDEFPEGRPARRFDRTLLRQDEADEIAWDWYYTDEWED